MEKRFQSQIDDKFMLRFPGDMREQIKSAAKANGRSMNAEIIHRLANYRETAGSDGPLSMQVDASQVREALHLVRQLQQAAEQASEACRKLGIKTGEA